VRPIVRAEHRRTSYTVYKRHFTVDELVAEVGGEPLFSGSYYILVRSIAGERRSAPGGDASE
jgi:hypothetical protein